MTKTAWNLALVQANPITGDYRGNAALLRQIAEKHRDADLIVTSEMFALGYPIEDFANRPEAARQSDWFLDRIEALAVELNGPAFLVGCLLPGPDKPFNAMCLIEHDGTRKFITKSELPNSGPFDEKRNFAANLTGVRMPVNFRGLQLGIAICEDMWHGGVARDLASEGAHLLLIPNGSPWHIDWNIDEVKDGQPIFSFTTKQDIRLDHARRRVRETGLPLVYVNQIGGQDELVFDGGSFVMDNHGLVIAQKQWVDAVIRVSVTLNAQGMADVSVDHGYEERQFQKNPLEDIYRAMMLGGADYLRKTGNSRIAIGLSGGMDSSLTAAAMADVIGAENVIGVMMPSSITSNESTNDAVALAERLGLVLDTVPIGVLQSGFKTETNVAIERIAAAVGRDAVHGVGDENSQARLRGMTLMAISNKIPGTMVFSTGNKSETAVGYCTAYGDMCGGYNILKDLPKTLVFAVAKWRNANRPEDFKGPEAPIPENVINKKPSAELSEGQTDEANLGPYELLDPTLKALVEDECSIIQAARRIIALFGDEAIRAMVKDASPVAYVERIADLIKIAEWKRRQAPIGTKLTARSFGRDRRYPVAGNASLRSIPVAA